jgi:putative replication protein
VLVVTVPDLMLRARKCYDEGQSESVLLDDLCRVDLLVLDEVGVQRDTRNEWVLLNQIIDRRLAAMKPVGVLTNLNFDELSKTLGERAMDRLTMDNGIWVNFTWGVTAKM